MSIAGLERESKYALHIFLLRRKLTLAFLLRKNDISFHQKAKPTDDCPHQFGYFRMGQRPEECNQFLNCVDGRAYGRSIKV